MRPIFAPDECIHAYSNGYTVSRHRLSASRGIGYLRGESQNEWCIGASVASPGDFFVATDAVQAANKLCIGNADRLPLVG